MIKPFTLKNNPEFLPVFYEKFREINVSRGVTLESINSILDAKSKLYDEGNLDGVVLTDFGKPVALAWVELQTPAYGSILVYTDDPKYKPRLMDELVASGLMRGVMAELTQFDSDDTLHELLRAKKIYELPRQRMVCHLPETGVYPVLEKNMSLVPLSVNTLDIASELSFLAHQVSGDYRGYVDMDTLPGRQGIEKRIHADFYGPVVHPASMMLMVDGKPAAICVNVQIACWGEAKVPWIFDIATHPEFMGLGYGETLLKYCKAVLADMGFPMWGLAVTLSNVGAIRVYERNEFILVDAFSEFLQL
ncbi:GNAT family N-acetyltransferase [bacterium]|nr:GNAT family N-acetyltransferase [bacterium]